MADQARAPILYIDANPFIYAVEGDDAIAAPIKELFEFLKRRPAMGVTSELTLAEVLPKVAFPRHKRQHLDLIIWSGIFQLQPVTRSILLETVRYRHFMTTRRSNRAKAMPKLPDAIHVVTAIQTKCKYFLSSDSGIKLPAHLQLVKPDERGISAVIKNLA